MRYFCSYDSLIAATALANNLELVTDNVSDFPGLEVVNPLKA
jgi:predicted nucleic acid-binding protein